MEPPPGFLVKRGVRGKPSGDLDRAGSINSAAPGTPTAAMAAAPAPDDTPFGFGAAPSVMSGSVAAFKRRCEWFYVDPSGEEHGPVSYQKLLSWYKKGHFPDDVKVRCRSPWYGIASLMKSMEEASEVETPTAAAATGAGPHRLSSFSAPQDSIPGPPPIPPPPPPPPRAASSSLGLAAMAPTSYDAELKLLFFGDPAWGLEPVWFYIDVRDVVQGPFSAREMVGWVASAMLKEDTRACGADPAAGTPTRTLFQPIGELLAAVRRGEPYRPFGVDPMRRKAPGLGSSGGSGLLGHPPPPPPPPPRRNDSSSLDPSAAYAPTNAFGVPGRSDAPTWRKDIPTPATGSTGSSGAGAMGNGSTGGSGPGNNSGGGSGSGSGSGGGGGSKVASGGAAAAISAALGVASDSGSAAGQADSSSGAGGAGDAGVGAGVREGEAPAGDGAAAGDYDSGAGDAGAGSSAGGVGDGTDLAAKIASYHDSNAAALSDALAPEDDFEYGDDMKVKRQTAARVPAGGRGFGVKEAGGRGVGLGRGLMGAGAPSAGGMGPAAMPPASGVQAAGVGGLSLTGLNPVQVQMLLQQAAQAQQQQQQAAAAGTQQVPGQQQAAAAAAGGAPGIQTQLGMMMGQAAPSMVPLSTGLVPASAPIALATAASGGLQGLSPALLNSLMSLQLQQQQQQQLQQQQQQQQQQAAMRPQLMQMAQVQVPGSNGMMLVSLPMTAKQQPQQQQPGLPGQQKQQAQGGPPQPQQQQAAVGVAIRPQLLQLMNSGQLQQAQVLQLLQAQQQQQQQQQAHAQQQQAVAQQQATAQQQVQHQQQQQQQQQQHLQLAQMQQLLQQQQQQKQVAVQQQALQHQMAAQMQLMQQQQQQQGAAGLPAVMSGPSSQGGGGVQQGRF